MKQYNRRTENGAVDCTRADVDMLVFHLVLSRYHQVRSVRRFREIQLAGKLLHRPVIQPPVCGRDDPLPCEEVHVSGAGGAPEGLR